MKALQIISLPACREFYKSLTQSERLKLRRNISKLDDEIHREQLLEERRISKMDSKLREILDLMGKHEVSLSELVAGAPRRLKVRPKPPFKYIIHMKNGESVKWSGLGMPPKIFRDAFKAGAVKEDFLINTAKPTKE